MIQDNVETLEYIQDILEYMWSDEAEDYAEVNNINFADLQLNSVEKILEWAKDNEKENHMFIKVLKLWQFYGFSE